jgi:septum formation protein
MLLLASQSPRRAELLNQMGIAFHTLAIDLDETRFTNEDPQAYVKRLACAKSALGWQRSVQDMPVLGADTIVVVEQQVLGKPKNKADAHHMLSLLSDNIHDVYTGVALTFAGKQVYAVVKTQVEFASLCSTQIDQYVKSIKGSYSAVVGLPLFETRQLLNEIGYKP